MRRRCLPFQSCPLLIASLLFALLFLPADEGDGGAVSAERSVVQDRKISGIRIPNQRFGFILFTGDAHGVPVDAPFFTRKEFSPTIHTASK